MSEVTDTTNAGEEVHAAGGAWVLSHVGPGVRAAFSRWAKARALAEVYALKGLGAGFREALTGLNADMAAGLYNWGSPLDPDGFGEAAHVVVNSPDGQVRLLALLLAEKHGEVSDEKAAELMNAAPEEFGRAIRACLSVPPLPKAPATKAPTTGAGSATA